MGIEVPSSSRPILLEKKGLSFPEGASVLRPPSRPNLNKLAIQEKITFFAQPDAEAGKVDLSCIGFCFGKISINGQ